MTGSAPVRPVGSVWPLADLVVTSGNLQLRPVTEADLPELATLLPADFELDPRAAAYDGLADARGASLCQSYWRALGTWTVDQWRLPFAVRLDGELVGVQELEAEDFPALRTVDSASWLVPGVRGEGIGKRMRAAVLALAFGPLEARAAITSAWHDNEASLGVSRALGYRPNGESLHSTTGRVDTMVHLRVVRADWLTCRRGHGVHIEGFDGCRPLFGLSASSASLGFGRPTTHREEPT